MRCRGGLERRSGVDAKVFQPGGEIEVRCGEVSAGDEVEDGLLDVGGQLGESVAGAVPGEGVELIEAVTVVELGDGVGLGGRQGGVDAGGKVVVAG